MMPSFLMLAGALVLAQPSPNDVDAPPGRVSLPLAQWMALVDAAAPHDAPVAPPAALVSIERRLEGAFRRGLLEGTLEARFEVLTDAGYHLVPVLGGGASPRAVLLDGQPTSLVARDGMYHVGVERPGRYHVRVDFLIGREEDRFVRRAQVALPPNGTTAVAIRVDERDVEASFARGAVVSATESDPGDADATVVLGVLEAGAWLDLTWRRRTPRDAAEEVRAGATVHGLVTIGEGLARGLSVLDLALTSGELDRVVLDVSEGAEVIDVRGDAVLQWRYVPGQRGQIEVLFRHLVADRARIVVEFQYAVTDLARILVATILPADGIPVAGVVGVQAPSGLDIAAHRSEAAEALGVRDLPAELTALTSRPIREAFRFAEAPTIELTATRHAQVELTSTLIDEIQASSVLLSDGDEITKLRVAIRNNTRQYLRAELPADAELTHALLDGRPVRPAAPAGDDGALLFSLRQSERIGPGEERVHRVAPDETLSAIAMRYYGDPDKWPLIVDRNRASLPRPSVLRVGQELVVPHEGHATVEESAFILELAYRVRGRPALGHLGRAALTLPRFDVDAMRVVWHLYLPHDVVPLDFASNLSQLTLRRFHLLRRLGDLLRSALGVTPAYAKGDYESILHRRRGIYAVEAERRGLEDVTPQAFPLAGDRYRFRRVLLDREQPRITVLYLSGGAAEGLRLLAFLAAALLTLLAIRPRAGLPSRLATGLGFAGLLVLAHYLMGVHLLLAHGASLGLALALVWLWRRRPPSAWRLALAAPWRLARLVDHRHLFGALVVLLVLRGLASWAELAPLILLVALALWWRRWAVADRAARATPGSPPPAPPPTTPPTAPPTAPNGEVSHA